MLEGAVKCLLRHFLLDEVTLLLNFILEDVQNTWKRTRLRGDYKHEKRRRVKDSHVAGFIGQGKVSGRWFGRSLY